MTTQEQPPVPPDPPPGQWVAYQGQWVWRPASQTPPPRTRNSTVLIILGVVVGLFLFGAVLNALNGDKSSPSPRNTRPAAITAAAPEEAYIPLVPEHITLELDITREACFGSAGCNVEWFITPTIACPTGPGSCGGTIEPGTEWLVTYTVNGLEDVRTESFEVQIISEDEYQYDNFRLENGSGSTAFEGAPVTATVTAVRQI